MAVPNQYQGKLYLHCLVNLASQARGLCGACYKARAIRILYDTPYCQRCDGEEPSTEALDAMIAEQSRPENLPAWWAQEADRVSKEQGNTVNILRIPRDRRINKHTRRY